MGRESARAGKREQSITAARPLVLVAMRTSPYGPRLAKNAHWRKAMANRMTTNPALPLARRRVDRDRDRPVDSMRAVAGIPAPEDTSKLAGASAGVLAGAAMGAFAGPIGIVAGGVIGAVAGAAAGVALGEQAAVTAAADRKLDEEIGVTGGDIGAASPNAPASSRGTFSGSSAGMGGTGGSGGTGTAPDEGPIPKGE